MEQTPQEKYDEFIANFRKEIKNKTREQRQQEFYDSLGEEDTKSFKMILEEIDLYRKEKRTQSKKEILKKIKNSPDKYTDRPYKNMDEIVQMIKDIREEDRLKKNYL